MDPVRRRRAPLPGRRVRRVGDADRVRRAGHALRPAARRSRAGAHRPPQRDLLAEEGHPRRSTPAVPRRLARRSSPDIIPAHAGTHAGHALTLVSPSGAPSGCSRTSGSTRHARGTEPRPTASGPAHPPPRRGARRARRQRRRPGRGPSPGTPPATSSSTSPCRAAAACCTRSTSGCSPSSSSTSSTTPRTRSIFADRSLLGLLWALRRRDKAVKHIVVMDDGADEDIPDDERIHDYEELLSAAEPVDGFRVEDENQAAAMCYTSGTTGNPKGVVYSHRSMTLHAIGDDARRHARRSRRATSSCPVVPMFHANAWGLPHAVVMAGATLVMPGPDLSPDALIQPDRGASGDARCRRADDLDGRPARARRAATSRRCTRDGLRRLGRARGAVGGLPRGDRPADPAGLGDDRDGPSARSRAASDASPTLAEDELADMRATEGMLSPLRRAARIVEGERRGAALGRQGQGELQVARAVDRVRLLPRRARGRLVHRGRLAPHRRRRDDQRRRLHPDRRPHQGRDQVRRRVDLVGRTGERDHGPPEGAEAAVIGRPRREVGRAAPGLRRARGRRGRSTTRRSATTSPSTWPSGGSRSASSSSTRCPKTSVGKFSKKTLRERFV